MRLVLGSKARELYQALDAVLEPPKPGKAAAQQVGPIQSNVFATLVPMRHVGFLYVQVKAEPCHSINATCCCNPSGIELSGA
jgi:hypothetical protein